MLKNKLKAYYPYYVDTLEAAAAVRGKMSRTRTSCLVASGSDNNPSPLAKYSFSRSLKRCTSMGVTDTRMAATTKSIRSSTVQKVLKSAGGAFEAGSVGMSYDELINYKYSTLIVNVITPLRHRTVFLNQVFFAVPFFFLMIVQGVPQEPVCVHSRPPH